ncbi:predicted protein [Streptomyces sp. SPB78]|nr:predicted protein [Streptomyces sp. SPB78]
MGRATPGDATGYVATSRAVRRAPGARGVRRDVTYATYRPRPRSPTTTGTARDPRDAAPTRRTPRDVATSRRWARTALYENHAPYRPAHPRAVPTPKAPPPAPPPPGYSS